MEQQANHITDDFFVSIIIPTLNAHSYIKKLLQVLLNQTRVPDEIIVIDSESVDETREICKEFTSVKLISIKQLDFDHGKTRDYALQASRGDYVLFLTQDALPADNLYVENILHPFEDKKVAMVTGRQIAEEGSSYIERLTREFNYPAQSDVKSKDDIHRLGIKTFFSSNCCAAYRRNAYNAVGGFNYPALISEDMIIAAKFIYADYSVSYCSEAKVIHSHKYSLMQQYSRNFDIAASITMNKDLFKAVSVQPEGVKMVKFVLAKLLKKGRLFQAFYYMLECVAKFLGYKHGKNYTKYKKKTILKKTMHKSFWEGNECVI